MDKERRAQKRAKDCVCPKAQVVFCQKTKVGLCRKDTGCCVSKDGSNITMKNVGKTISVFFQRTIAQKVKHLQDNLTHAEVKKRVEIYADV